MNCAPLLLSLVFATAFGGCSRPDVTPPFPAEITTAAGAGGEWTVVPDPRAAGYPEWIPVVTVAADGTRLEGIPVELLPKWDRSVFGDHTYDLWVPYQIEPSDGRWRVRYRRALIHRLLLERDGVEVLRIKVRVIRPGEDPNAVRTVPVLSGEERIM